MHLEMKINSVDWLVADRCCSIKSNKAHCDPCRTKKEGCVELTSCQANDYYRNEAASGQGEKKILSLKKLMHKIVELVQ